MDKGVPPETHKEASKQDSCLGPSPPIASRIPGQDMGGDASGLTRWEQAPQEESLISKDMGVHGMGWEQQSAGPCGACQGTKRRRTAIGGPGT